MEKIMSMCLSSTLCGQKGKQHKVTLFMGQEKKKICLDVPAK